MGKFNKSNHLYLQHILEAIEKVKIFIYKIEKEPFKKNLLIDGAVSFELAVRGEAAAHFDNDFRECNNHIPWSRIVGK